MIRGAARGAVVLLATAALAACDNEIPTANGSDLFPGGEVPTTLLVEVTGTDLILREEVYEGFGDPRRAPFLIVANDFDGAFDAHTLARFADIPDSVTYTSGTSRREEISAYQGGRVLTQVDSLATFPRSTATLYLWELTQPWDSATVTWENASEQPGQETAWTTPGGSFGTLLDQAFWFPGDTAQKDTVTWELDSLAVIRLRSPDHPGVIVTSDQPGVRVKLSALTFEGDAHPSGRPDTVVAVRTSEGPQTFVYTPDTPQSAAVLRAGGLTGDRSLLTLDLEQEVEACPAGGGPCSLVPLSEVTLNRAQLVFEPVQVPDGYRPLATPRVVLRSVAEPELGRFAPLGAVLATDTISPSAFAAGTDREFEMDLTTAVLQFLAEQARAEREGEEVETELSFALLADFEVPDLGLLWFQRSPTLRLVYTLPLNPSLP
ncbi:MAG TPA: hypothetical protein VFZ18_00975 [Longimicrobiaceae bacterium]